MKGSDSLMAQRPTGSAELRDLAAGYHESLYGCEATALACVPGTAALLGEYTDACGGVVLLTLVDRYVVVSLSPRKDQTLSIRLLQEGAADASPITASISLKEVDDVATQHNEQRAQESRGRRRGTPAKQAPHKELPQPGTPQALAYRVGGALHSLAARQLIPRSHYGFNISIVSTIPSGVGLGALHSLDAALGLAVCSEHIDISEAPNLAKISEALDHALGIFTQDAVMPARHTAALRGKGKFTAVVDYADGSLTQAPHPSTTGLDLYLRSSTSVTPGDTLGAGPSCYPELLRARSFFAQAAAAFGTESLRLLPDAHSRTLDWLRAVHSVQGAENVPSIVDADTWLSWWDLETQRAQQLAGALRSRRHEDALSLVNDSQAQLALSYAFDDSLVRECLKKGAASARLSTLYKNTPAALAWVRREDEFSAEAIKLGRGEDATVHNANQN